MKPLLSAMLKAFGVEQDPEWIAAAQAGEFYIVAEKTLIGQYAMGSTEFELDGQKYLAPCVHPTQAQAQAELDEEIADYAERVAELNAEALAEWEADGEEADDFEPDEDECLMGVYKMRWDGGDNVIIESVCGEFIEDDKNTWQFHAGL